MRKLLPVFAFLLIIQCCLAKEVKTVTVFGGFLSSVTGGVIYSKHFDFKSPDGFSKAYYVKARIILDTLYADTTIYMTLNGTYCNPKSYSIPNAESRYLIEFSCTDAFKGEGTYEVKFYSTKDVKNLYAEWEITYLNNPEVEIKHVYKRVKARMIVKGTDYVFGETAKVFLQLLKDEQPVNNAICLMDLYDPNNTRILDDVVMPYLNDSDGLYYYEYKIPPVQGVYMLSVKCLYLVNYTMDYADAFNLLHGDLIEGTYEDTWNEDRIYHTIQEVSPDYMDFYYEFENVTLPDNATQMVVMWKGEWTDHDETVYMYLWNWNTSTWDLMPNRIAWYTNMISNTIENESISCYLHPNGTVRVRFTDSDVTSDKGYLRTDLLEVQLHYAIYGAIEMIRGGGEIHVTNLAERTSNLTTYTIWELLMTETLMTHYSVPSKVYAGREFKGIFEMYTINATPVNADYVEFFIYYPDGTLAYHSNMTQIGDGAYLAEWDVEGESGIYMTLAKAHIGDVVINRNNVFIVEPIGPADIRVDAGKMPYRMNYLSFNITIENNGNFGRDFEVTYWLEKEGNKYSQKKETVYVPAQKSVTLERMIYVPTWLWGAVFVKAMARYDNINVTAYDIAYIPKIAHYAPFNFTVTLLLEPRIQRLKIVQESKVILEKWVKNGEKISLRPDYYKFIFYAEGYEEKEVDVLVNKNLVITSKLKRRFEKIVYDNLGILGAFVALIVIGVAITLI